MKTVTHDVKGGGDIDNGAEIRAVPQTNRILHLNYFFGAHQCNDKLW